jgi:spore maturation protein CgeB
LRVIKKNLKVKFIFFWWDTCSKSFLDSHHVLLEFADLNLVNDNPNRDFFNCEQLILDKTLFLWTPLPTSFCKNTPKEIDLAFLGQISSYRNYRSKYIFEIMKNNIPGIFSLFDREFQPNYLEYSMLIAKSRIGLNFSFSVDCHQLKGRIFETILSGTLLLESKNHQITNLFTEGEDYVAFEDEYDLIKKIKFFLKNEKEREKIANSGQKKILQKYSSYNYWNLVFIRIEELEKNNNT